MASHESTRTAAYSEDLPWRMVYQRKALEYSVRRVAENLGVSPATVSRTLEVFDRTGTVSNQEYPEDHNRAKKLTQTDEFLILQLVTDSPGIYLGEIQTELACSTGTFVTHPQFVDSCIRVDLLERSCKVWHCNTVRS